MTTSTFTKRKLEKITIKSVDASSIITTGGGFSVPDWVTDVVKPGETYYLELHKFNHIGGLMQVDGLYVFHRSDEYFANQLNDYLAEQKVKREKFYQDNFVSWTFRTAALPDRYKNRLHRFLNDPDKGEEFRKEPMGWGYELIICELAVLYGKSGGEDSNEINEFARRHGTSGNQHDVAKAWAKNPDVVI